MKRTVMITLAAAFMATAILSACSSAELKETPAPETETSTALEVSQTAAPSSERETSAEEEQTAGYIYLYWEVHAVEKVMEKEAQLWNDYYHNQGLRHLFIELPYYTAELLNLWMHSDSDAM